MLNIPEPPVLIKPPPEHAGCPTKYNKTMAESLLTTIATQSTTIKEIAENHGITKDTMYRWILINEQFSDSYLHALELRAMVEVDTADSEVADLMHYIDNSNDDPRKVHTKIQGTRIRLEQLRWKASKYNRRVFGDKLEVDQHLTVEPAKERETAWAAHKQAAEAEYTEES